MSLARVETARLARYRPRTMLSEADERPRSTAPDARSQYQRIPKRDASHLHR
jgi:hypothetical protein